MARTRRPLTSRPLDLLYASFFLLHIPASLLMDFQALYPRALVPHAVRGLIPSYVAMSGDPLLAGAFAFHGDRHAYAWFRAFLWLELTFQFPVFFLGIRALWNDSPSIYLLLLIYGASTATTTLPCVATVLAVPGTADAAAALTSAAVTPAQRAMLLASYVPFLVVPLIMTLDMARRLSKLLGDQRVRTGSLKREE